MTKKITKLMLNGEEYEIREYQQGGWQPGANTFMYLPMTSDFDDATGNNMMTNSGATITTQDGINCGYFNGNRLTGSVTPSNSTNKTFSVWIKPSSSSGWIIGSNHSAVYSGDFFVLDSNYDNGVIYNWYRPYSDAKVLTSVLPIAGVWSHICYSNGKIYLNGTDITTSTGSGTMSVGYAYTIGQQNNGNNSYQGYMSELIVETVEWTADEVLSYYNKTKDNYPSSEPQAEPCHRCEGTGEVDCDVCGGTGEEMCPSCQGTGQIGDPEDPESRTPCPDCDGTGFMGCGNCGGTGKVTCEWCGGTGEEPGE